MKKEIDIFENDILEKYPGVLEILLADQTTGQNGNIIMPRVKKDKELQKSRSRDMAEVFTPSWVCNSQNNLIDSAWFECENVFNTEIEDKVCDKEIML